MSQGNGTDPAPTLAELWSAGCERGGMAEDLLWSGVLRFIRRVLATRVLDPDELDDLVGRVVLKLLADNQRRMDLYDPNRATLESYLATIAVREHVDYQRGAERQHKLHRVCQDSMFSPREAGADPGKEPTSIVNDAVNLLTGRTREAVQRWLELDSSRDVAATLEVSESRVSELLKDGRLELRKLLEPEDDVHGRDTRGRA